MSETEGRTIVDGAGEPELVPVRPSAVIDSQEWLDDLIANGRVTPKGAQVARFIAANPRGASLSSASELAGRIGVNVATVVRFAQGLGFSGWREFQLHFRHRYLGSLLTVDLLRDRGARDGLTAIDASLHRDIENLQWALTSVNAEPGQAAARAIAEARKTVVISSGSYASVGVVLAHLASFMGYSVTLETRGGAHIIAALASLERGDCLVAISFWRLLKDIVLAARHARDCGISTIAITDSLFSPLAQAVDHPLIVPTEGVRFFQSVTAAVSITYGLLAELHDLGGERVAAAIEHAEELYEKLDVLYT